MKILLDYITNDIIACNNYNLGMKSVYLCVILITTPSFVYFFHEYS